MEQKLCIGLGIGTIALLLVIHLYARGTDCETACGDAYEGASQQCEDAYDEAVLLCDETYEEEYWKANAIREDSEFFCENHMESPYVIAVFKCSQDYHSERERLLENAVDILAPYVEAHENCIKDPNCNEQITLDALNAAKAVVIPILQGKLDELSDALDVCLAEAEDILAACLQEASDVYATRKAELLAELDACKATAFAIYQYMIIA